MTKLNNKILSSGRTVSRAFKAAGLLVTAAAYLGAFIFLRERMQVSVNYFVLLPMFGASLMYGFWGGVISGLLALPSNLLLFFLFNDMAYAPESKITAFLFGFITGTVLGYLSTFYERLQAEVWEHRQARRLLDKTIEQKQLLLRESHHRVKNNLAIIMGIIELELLEEKDKGHSVFLQSLVDRIRSVSTMQNLLFGLENISDIEIKPFIEKLIQQIQTALSVDGGEVCIAVDVEDIKLDIDTALPIGLILNESCTNSIKYAFQNIDNPYIHISLKKHDDGCVLSVRDNGTGLPEEVLTCGSDSVGMNLIEKLVRQMNAACIFKNDNGTVLTIRLQKKTPLTENARQESPLQN